MNVGGIDRDQALITFQSGNKAGASKWFSWTRTGAEGREHKRAVCKES